MIYASWGRLVGPVVAVREGLAERLRRQAELVIALDPGYESGGAHRIPALPQSKSSVGTSVPITNLLMPRLRSRSP